MQQQFYASSLRQSWLSALALLVNLLSLSSAENPPPDQVLTRLKQLSLEDLGAVEIQTVYGASKHEQTLSEAPSPVTIVTADEIKKAGYRTLAEILNSVGGFYVTYDRSYTVLGMRGVNRPGDFGGRILLMVDGHHLNDPVYDSAFGGTEFPLDVDLIERVEIIRGPGSSLYGDNAFFAVINVITRRGRAVNGPEASFSAGSYDTYTGRASYGKHFTNGLELLLSGTLLESEGHDWLSFPEFSTVNGGNARGIDGQSVKQAFASLSYGDFSLQGLFGHRHKDLPTAAYGAVFNDPRLFIVDERAFADLKYEHEFGGEWQVLARAYFDHYRFAEDTPVPDLLVPGQVVLNHDDALARWYGLEAQISRQFFERHRVTLGGEARWEEVVNQKNFDRDPPQTYLDANNPITTLSLYLQDEFAVLTNLTLNAGVRYDHVGSFGSTVNPRAGLIYRPWAPTTFKLLYGEAFRAPNAYERGYEVPGFSANPSLGPETIRSYQFVWEQQIGPHLQTSVTPFYNDIHSLIDEVTDPLTLNEQFINQAAVDVWGAEIEVRGHWAHGLRTRASYTFAQATDTQSGQWLNNSPTHLAKFSLAVPLYREKIYLSPELVAMSRRSTGQGNLVRGFALANLTLFSHDLLPRLEFSGSIYNVFDTKYRDPVSPDFVQDSLEQDGRTFRLKLTYRF